MGVDRAERSIEIGGPPTACFDAVTDFESYPAWQSLVSESRVVERDAATGLAVVVESRIETKLRGFRYVLRYAYDAPTGVSWQLVDGDVKSLDGSYTFDPSGGSTVATYRLAIDLGSFGRMLPGEMKRKATEHLMTTTMTELKARVEGDE